MAIDRVQIRLWTQARGAQVFDPSGGVLGYLIPAGAAQFLVSGIIEGVGSNRFMAVSTSDIWISNTGGIWDIDEFAVGFTDFVDGQWTISIGESQWLE